MIVAKLYGGIGNQMFQYAAAKRLAQSHDASLKLDLTWFTDKEPGVEERDYGLAVFALKAPALKPLERRLIYRDGIGYKIAAKLLIMPELSIINEKTKGFDASILHLPDNCLLNGFWQSELYFTDAEEIIREEFAWVKPLDQTNQVLANHIEETVSVSLHVRRGDYLTNKIAKDVLGALPEHYYRNALQLLGKSLKNFELFVFSDDLDWCKRKLKLPENTTFVDGNVGDKCYIDMRLMSMCQHHIIANSSFSWWGAWLGANPAKQVIAPKAWFRDSSYSADTLIPSSWITL